MTPADRARLEEIRERCERVVLGSIRTCWNAHPEAFNEMFIPSLSKRIVGELAPWLLDQLASARAEGEKLVQLQADVQRIRDDLAEVAITSRHGAGMSSFETRKLLQAALDRSKA